MLTEEQIKNLKPGDTVLVEAEVASRLEYGAIVTHGCITHALLASKLYPLPSEHGTSVPTPKHDPTRLFRKGDKVRVVRSKGRSYSKYWEKRLGQILTVTWSEDENTSPEVDEQTIDPSYLELITPVEELEPYYIEEETFDYEIRNANDDPDIGTSLAFHIMFQDPDESEILRVKSYYESYVYSREHAEADAKAEADRLNAEWRKDQNNV